MPLKSLTILLEHRWYVFFPLEIDQIHINAHSLYSVHAPVSSINSSYVKRFYTRETIRGIRISRLAGISPLLMIGWDYWIKRIGNYLSCIEGKGGLKNLWTFALLHKLPRYLFLYYKISSIETNYKLVAPKPCSEPVPWKIPQGCITYPLLPFLFHMAEGSGIKNAGKTLNIKDELYNNLFFQKNFSSKDIFLNFYSLFGVHQKLHLFRGVSRIFIRDRFNFSDLRFGPLIWFIIGIFPTAGHAYDQLGKA